MNEQQSLTRIDKVVDSFVRRLGAEGYTLPIPYTTADKETVKLSNDLQNLIKLSGLNYKQAKKALIMADEGLYREITRKKNVL